MDSITIIEINGKSFVSGLMWKPLRSVRNYMAEAKSIGKREGWDMVAVRGVEKDVRRRSKVLQAGFAPKETKPQSRKARAAMRNMYSLAASLAGVLGEDWLGAFELGDGRFAFVAVHQGGIMPGRDRVGDQVEIESALRETYSDIAATGIEPKVIAPAAWEFGGDPETLESLLTTAVVKPDHRLKPLTMGLTQHELIVGALLIVALLTMTIVGIHLWKKHREHDAQIAKLRSLAAIQSAQDQAMAAAQAALMRPWTVTPTTEDFIDACAQSMEHVQLAIGGWPFDNGRCVLGKLGNRAADDVIATYHRGDKSTVADFIAAAKALGAAPSIFDKGNTGAVHLRLPVPKTIDSKANGLPALGDELTGMTTRFQAIPDAVDPTTFTANVVPWEAPKNQPKLPPPGWQTATVQVQARLGPQYLFENLNVPGLRLYEIAVSIHSDTKAEEAWTLTGELYGK